MHESKSHFVLVHGDCHGAWCWYKVSDLLRSAGHSVSALDMACCGIQQKRVEDVPSIMDYFAPLMLFMESLSPEEKVILVGHSRGGIDISMAMERFPEKVAAAVFVTASMPGPDLDLPTVSKEFARRSGSDTMDNEYYYGKGQDKPPTSFLFGVNFLASKLYQLSPTEDLTLATSLIRLSPLYDDFRYPTKGTALTKQNYGSVPRVYIVCEQDKVMNDTQRWLIDNNPPNEVKVSEGSDHMAMMSKPKELFSYLQEVADKYSC